MKKLFILLSLIIMLTSVTLSASAGNTLDIIRESSSVTPAMQNGTGTEITSDGGALTYTAATWDGITYSCWLMPSTFTPAVVGSNQYLNLKFKVTGAGGSRITLSFNEGNLKLADFFEDDFDTITYDDAGNAQFAEGNYAVSIKLSDTGFTPTNDTYTLTGWILNFTLGSISFDVFEISDTELVIEDEPTVEESEPAVEESEPAVEESEPAVEESEPAVEESEPAVEESEPAVEESEPAVEESEAVVESDANEVSNSDKEDGGNDKLILIAGIALGVIILAVVIILVARKKH